MEIVWYSILSYLLIFHKQIIIVLLQYLFCIQLYDPLQCFMEVSQYLPSPLISTFIISLNLDQMIFVWDGISLEQDHRVGWLIEIFTENFNIHQAMNSLLLASKTFFLILSTFSLPWSTIYLYWTYFFIIAVGVEILSFLNLYILAFVFLLDLCYFPFILLFYANF